MKKILMMSALLALGFTTAAHAAGDVEKGKQTFKQCALCHNIEPNKTKIGPSLFGVVGRKAGTEANFPYSSAMKSFGKTWTPDELNTYLEDPRKVVPGTKMIFPGLKKEQDRQNVIAYLETLK